MKYAFIQRHRRVWPISVQCRVLEVSVAGYHEHFVRRARTAQLDLEHCPNCGGELKIIAAILEQPGIETILTHPGLQARAPPRAPARGQALQAA